MKTRAVAPSVSLLTLSGTLRRSIDTGVEPTDGTTLALFQGNKASEFLYGSGSGTEALLARVGMIARSNAAPLSSQASPWARTGVYVKEPLVYLTDMAEGAPGNFASKSARMVAFNATLGPPFPSQDSGVVPLPIFSLTPSFLSDATPDESYAVTSTVTCDEENPEALLFQALVGRHGIRAYTYTDPASTITELPAPVQTYGRISAVKARGNLLFALRVADFDQLPTPSETHALEIYDMSDVPTGPLVLLGRVSLSGFDVALGVPSYPVHLALHPVSGHVYIAHLFGHSLTVVSAQNAWAPVIVNPALALPNFPEFSDIASMDMSEDGNWLNLVSRQGELFPLAISPYTTEPGAAPPTPVLPGGVPYPLLGVTAGALAFDSVLPGGSPIVTGPVTPMGPSFPGPSYQRPSTVGAQMDAVWGTTPTTILVRNLAPSEASVLRSLQPYYNFLDRRFGALSIGYMRVKGDTHDIVGIANHTDRTVPSLNYGTTDYAVEVELLANTVSFLPLRRLVSLGASLPNPVAIDGPSIANALDIAVGSQFEAIVARSTGLSILQKDATWSERQFISGALFNGPVATWDKWYVAARNGSEAVVYERNKDNLEVREFAVLPQAGAILSLAIHTDYWMSAPGVWSLSGFLVVGTAGSVTIYRYNEGLNEWDPVDTLVNGDTTFGASVAVWSDNDTARILIGASATNTVFQYDLTGLGPSVLNSSNVGGGWVVAAHRAWSLTGDPAASTLRTFAPANVTAVVSTFVGANGLGSRVGVWQALAVASTQTSPEIHCLEVTGAGTLQNDRFVAASENNTPLGFSENWIVAGASAVIAYAFDALPTYTVQTVTLPLRPVEPFGYVPSPTDQYGAAVALGHFASAVSAPGANGGDGVVSIYERFDSMVGKLALTVPGSAQAWGTGIHLHNRTLIAGSGDVNATRVITADRDDAPAGLGSWRQSSDLMPNLTGTNIQTVGSFGVGLNTVETYGDRLAVVGAPTSDRTAFAGCGAVFIYERPSVGGAWTQVAAFGGQALTEALGTSVSCMGNIVIAGAPGYNNNRGRIFVYVRDMVTGVWSQSQIITEANPTVGHRYGLSVSMAGDSFYTASPHSTNVKVWRHRRITESTFGTGFPTLGGAVNPVYANPSAVLPTRVSARGVSQFSVGFAMDLGTAGRYALGQRNDLSSFSTYTGYVDGTAVGELLGTGVATAESTFMVGREDDALFLVRELKPRNLLAVYPDYPLKLPAGISGWLTSPTGATDDYFGYAVSMAPRTVAVGAPMWEGACGNVYLYFRDGGSWFHGGTLACATPMMGGGYGAAIAQLDDTYLFVYAPGEHALFAYKRTDALLNSFGPLTVVNSLGAAPQLFAGHGRYTVVADGSFAVVADDRRDEVVIYEHQGADDSWVSVQAIVDPGWGEGFTVALHGRILCIGAPAVGRVDIYLLTTTNVWTLAATLTDPDAGASDFGYALAFFNLAGLGKGLAVGAPSANANNGKVHMYSASTWVLVQSVTGTVTGEQLGRALLGDVTNVGSTTVLATAPAAGLRAVYRIDPSSPVGTGYDFPYAWMKVLGQTGMDMGGYENGLAIATGAAHLQGQLPTVAVFDAAAVTPGTLTPATVTPPPVNWADLPMAGALTPIENRYIHAGYDNGSPWGGVGRPVSVWSGTGCIVNVPHVRHSITYADNQGLRVPRKYNGTTASFEIGGTTAAVLPVLTHVSIKILHPATAPFPPLLEPLAVREGDKVTIELDFDAPISGVGVPTASLLWWPLTALPGAAPFVVTVPFVYVTPLMTKAVFEVIVPPGSLSGPGVYGRVNVYQGLPIVRMDNVYDSANALKTLNQQLPVNTVLPRQCMVSVSASTASNTFGDPYIMPLFGSGKLLKATGGPGARHLLFCSPRREVAVEGVLKVESGQEYWDRFVIWRGESFVEVDAETWMCRGGAMEALVGSSELPSQFKKLSVSRRWKRGMPGVSVGGDSIYRGIAPSHVLTLALTEGLALTLMRFDQHRGIRSGLALHVEPSESGLQAVSEEGVGGLLVRAPGRGDMERVVMRDSFVRVEKGSGRVVGDVVRQQFVSVSPRVHK
jgi:hypothetical protein